jgi:ribose transport system substrate-binding protein
MNRAFRKTLMISYFGISRTGRRAALYAALVTSTLLVASNPASAQIGNLAKQSDITPLCGSKPAVVALLDGFGGAAWFKTTAQEFRDELSKCKNVTKVVYLNANGSQQKYNSDFNSLVSQKVDVIVSFTHFGDASLPVMRNATKAGVTVVPFFAKISGSPGRDYVDVVYQDPIPSGLMWADFLAKTVKTGNVIFLGGPPGATSSQRFMDAFKDGVKKYPGLKLVEENYVVTNWNPADAQKAITALIAKHGKIDGIGSDYGLTTNAAIKAFEQAGLPIPAQATLASSNELNCKYLEYKKAGKAWPYFSLDGTTTLIRAAARRAMAAHSGTPYTEPLGWSPYPYVDSTTNTDPRCDMSFPPDADLSGRLTNAALTELFK